MFDVGIIGGGVVGLAILRRLAMAGLDCVLLEKGKDILSGASKGNSALLHTGFDAPPDSLELACMKAGYAEYLDIRERLNLPLLRTSAHVVAWSEAELAKLPGIVAKAHENGIADVDVISREALRQAEPRLDENALGAVRVPGEHVIDPWSAPLAYARQALAAGATIMRDCEVSGGTYEKGHWTLHAGERRIDARVAVNAAGLFGDVVERISRQPSFTIKPRRGQFVVFDKPAAKLVASTILPVPTERTKGVVLFRSIFGNLVIGPTAEETDEREYASCDHDTLHRLKLRAIEMVPELRDAGVNAIYAGLRPATEHKGYLIEALRDRNWITVAGIRSTGLTGSLGIARHVERLYADNFGELRKREPSAIWTPVPNLAEHRPRPYQQGGEIVCHCEWVTRQEISDALAGDLPARDIDGLKRRTRALMGRCQGFNCGAEVRAMLHRARDG
ncbi:MAG: NAD(P)/FAD-dependent oxidoreductase [Parvibaculaceae bacterium]